MREYLHLIKSLIFLLFPKGQKKQGTSETSLKQSFDWTSGFTTSYVILWCTNTTSFPRHSFSTSSDRDYTVFMSIITIFKVVSYRDNNSQLHCLLTDSLAILLSFMNLLLGKKNCKLSVIQHLEKNGLHDYLSPVCVQQIKQLAHCHHWILSNSLTSACLRRIWITKALRVTGLIFLTVTRFVTLSLNS